jgi:hypothetical protein
MSRGIGWRQRRRFAERLDSPRDLEHRGGEEVCAAAAEELVRLRRVRLRAAEGLRPPEAEVAGDGSGHGGGNGQQLPFRLVEVAFPEADPVARPDEARRDLDPPCRAGERRLEDGVHAQRPTDGGWILARGGMAVDRAGGPDETCRSRPSRSIRASAKVRPVVASREDRISAVRGRAGRTATDRGRPTPSASTSRLVSLPAKR